MIARQCAAGNIQQQTAQNADAAGDYSSGDGCNAQRHRDQQQGLDKIAAVCRHKSEKNKQHV